MMDKKKSYLFGYGGGSDILQLGIQIYRCKLFIIFKYISKIHEEITNLAMFVMQKQQ
jgi:hypothetical protein